MPRSPLVPLACLVALTACGGSNNPPSPGGSSGGDSITGNERIGWRQTAETTAELSMYRYALYVDNQRRVLEGETCSPGAGVSVDCSVRLPPLSPGRRSLEIAAFFSWEDSVIEGPRSPVLQVTVAGTAASSGNKVVVGGTFATADGVTLQSDVIARDLRRPVDLAVSADGRVFVAERGGGLRIVPQGRGPETRTDDLLSDLGEERSGHGAELLSVALAPDFQTSGLLHIAYLTTAPDQPTLRLVRMRDVRGVLGQPAVVASYAVSAADISGVVRFGPDTRLHVGIGSGSNPDEAQRPSAVSGKILRLNEDGTTPGDNPGGSPVLSMGHSDPEGLAWLPQDHSLWEVERDERGDELNRIRSGANYGWPQSRDRGSQPSLMAAPALAIDSRINASGLATVALQSSPWFGDLIMSSLDQRDLLRFDVPADGPPRLADRLLQGRFGRIAEVASGADGALYFVTNNEDEWGPDQDVLVRVQVRTRVPQKALD